jgi:hypothetical protein
MASAFQCSWRHAAVAGLHPQALYVAGQLLKPGFAQKFEGRHDGQRPGVARVDKMGDVPVVRAFSAGLGEIGAGALGAQQNGLIGHVVAGLGDAFGAQAPVDAADGLAVAVNAPIGDVDLTAGLFHRRARPEDLRRLGPAVWA